MATPIRSPAGWATKVLVGGLGNDTYVFAPNDGNDTIGGESGGGNSIVIQNVTKFTTLDFSNSSTGSGGDLIIQYDGGQITYQGLMGSGNTQNISFGGATFLGYALGNGAYVVNTDQSGSAANDLIAGDSAANVITGGDGNELLFGGAGDDTISTTGTGSNLLVGGAGNDSLTGSDGNDWLSGGAGNDTMTGGAGSDTFIYYKGDGTDTVAGGTGASWTDLIELRDGGAALGTYGVDWTLSIIRAQSYRPTRPMR